MYIVNPKEFLHNTVACMYFAGQSKNKQNGVSKITIQKWLQMTS